MSAPPRADFPVVEHTGLLRRSPGRGSRGKQGRRGSFFSPCTAAMLVSLTVRGRQMDSNEEETPMSLEGWVREEGTARVAEPSPPSVPLRSPLEHAT